jgi:myb proto-oncogene protein
MRKRLWSPDEDEKLQRYVSQNGFGNWSEVAKKTGNKNNNNLCAAPISGLIWCDEA